jgi:hypothetical protein
LSLEYRAVITNQKRYIPNKSLENVAEFRYLGTIVGIKIAFTKQLIAG